MTLSAAHTIEVAFFESTGGASLTVSYQGPGITKHPFPTRFCSAIAPPNNRRVTNPGDQAGIRGHCRDRSVGGERSQCWRRAHVHRDRAAAGTRDQFVHGDDQRHRRMQACTACRLRSGRRGEFGRFVHWTVTVPNAGPSIGRSRINRALVGDSLSLQVGERSERRSAFVFASGLPPPLAINQTTGLITGTIGTPARIHRRSRSAMAPCRPRVRSRGLSLIRSCPLVIQPIASPPREVGTPIAFTAAATGTVL